VPHLAIDTDACGRDTLAPDCSHQNVALTLIQANRHLWHAVTAFNLTLQSGHGGAIEDSGGLGIWDGEAFVFEEAQGGWSWWSMAKVRRYLACRELQRGCLTAALLMAQ